ILVCKVYTSITTNVSKKIKSRIDMCDRVGLFANEILQSVDGGVYADITNPFRGPHTVVNRLHEMGGVPLADIYDNIKGVLNTFIWICRPRSNSLAICSSI